MWAKRCFSLTITVLVCWQYLLKEAAASCAWTHPQKLFCDADYVFKFKAMTWPMSAENRVGASSDRVGRRKRLVPGGGMMAPRVQTAEVGRFFKGRDMVMPMMTPVDTFSVGEAKVEATIQLGLFEKPFKKNAVYVYLGKMFRYTNKTIMPMDVQVMMAQCGNTMPLSAITKVINRGFRKKYDQGCKAGCQVQTHFTATEATPKSKTHCIWNPTAYGNKVDCRRTAQFCYMGKRGYCEWKKTKAYKKCLVQNKISERQRQRGMP